MGGRWRLVGLAIAAAALVTYGCSDSTAQRDVPNRIGEEPAEQGATASSAEKVTVAGDSISVGLGVALREAVDNDVEVKVIGEEGTGLARLDRFDWPTRLEELAEDFPPEVLVFSLGSNDAQDLTDGDSEVAARLRDDDAWDAEYSRRLAQSFDAFEDTDTVIVWVGQVVTEQDVVGATNRRVHRLAEELAAERDWVVIGDLTEMLDTGETEATECLVPDGLHLTTKCLDRAAQQLANQAPIG